LRLDVAIVVRVVAANIFGNHRSTCWKIQFVDADKGASATGFSWVSYASIIAGAVILFQAGVGLCVAAPALMHVLHTDILVVAGTLVQTVLNCHAVEVRFRWPVRKWPRVSIVLVTTDIGVVVVPNEIR